MASTSGLAPGVPPDYYERLRETEDRHWWYTGMREIEAALLGERLRRPGQRLLDAGCGTGGFLRWALDAGAADCVAGVDVSSVAIELARSRVPEAELHVAPLHELPLADASFDLAVTHDVLQHVPEDELAAGLRELRRVLAPDGTLLVRTNGSRRLRRERHDWRAYDRESLIRDLEGAGLVCERATFANVLLSALAAARGRVPHAPTTERHGIPRADASPWRRSVGLALLRAEARYLARPGRRLPYGHTLVAVARRPGTQV